MLEEAVASARAAAGGEAPPAERWSPAISLGTSVLIPESYVRDLDVRLTLYRRVAALEDQAGIDEFIDELADRFGPPPASVRHLLEIMAIKQLCRQSGIERVEAEGRRAELARRRLPGAVGAGSLRVGAGERVAPQARQPPRGAAPLARHGDAAGGRPAHPARPLRPRREFVAVLNALP